MDPLWTLLIAMLVVVGGVLGLRLHAFLALLAGAVVVAILTPREAVHHSEVRSIAARVTQISATESPLGFRLTVVPGDDSGLTPGPLLVFRERSRSVMMTELGQVNLLRAEPMEDAVRLAIESDFEPKVGDWLLSREADEPARAAANRLLGARIAEGFGATCSSIGILIAMAALIGKCLLDSGAAERIVNATRNVVGERNTPVAFVLSGFVVGIPVFFDTVFYLLMPLAKALRIKTGKDYLLYVLSVVVGATMAHSLVPPTPGPMFVATELGVSIGLMMIGGTVVGSCAAAAGYLYAVWANRRWTIPLRDLQQPTLPLNEAHSRGSLPPLWLSLLPILLPVILLGGLALWELTDVAVPQPIRVFGEKNVALMVSAAVALITLAWCGTPRENVSAAVQDALLSAGGIILITSAGGTFGRMLRKTGMALAIEQRLPLADAGLMVLLMAFLITMVIRAAQGSATVAMLTSVGIVAPLASNINLPFHPLYLALAIGCGSKPFMWMNDSGFWIVCRMSGMTERETLKTVTVALTLMGVVGIVLVLLGARFWPLI